MRRLAKFGVLACACAVLLVSGCAGVAEWAGLAKPEPPRTRAVLVLLDLSGSARHMRPEFEHEFAALLDTMAYGDTWVVYPIDKNALQMSRSLASTSVPSFMATTTNPAGANVQRANHEKTYPLERYRTGLASVVASALAGPDSGGTDLGGVLHLAASEFARDGATENVLVIFSDMNSNGERINTEAKDFDPEMALKALEENGELAQLGGVNVWGVGAYAADATQWDRTHEFWVSYFEKCGANLTYYGRDLPESALRPLQDRDAGAK